MINLKSKKPNVLFAGMGAWHMAHTAANLEKLSALGGFWTGSKPTSKISKTFTKLIWPYYLAQRPFSILSYRCEIKSKFIHISPFNNIEEDMRWRNLFFYDRWINCQRLPEHVNVVQAPMGSCLPLFRLADRSKRPVLKVFDAPNSHPTTFRGFWQRECDIYSPNYYIPMSRAALSKINRELDMADMILCPSTFVKDTMVMNGIPEKKCFISHFGVDTSIFKQRERLPDVPTFICVGSICLRKGHQYLFRAFQKLREKIPNARLICVGGVRPDFKKEWKVWKNICEHYEYLEQKNLAEILAECTAFVLPSMEEGFARVLSEAMAAGLPIIATYESGATTVISNNQEGFVVKSRDIDGLAQAMIEIALNPEANKSMGINSLTVGTQSNTWKDYTNRIYDEYSRRLHLM